MSDRYRTGSKLSAETLLPYVASGELASNGSPRAKTWQVSATGAALETLKEQPSITLTPDRQDSAWSRVDGLPEMLGDNRFNTLKIALDGAAKARTEGKAI